MSKYARNTTVSENQSINDIEDVLDKYGAENVAYGMTKLKAKIAFSLQDRHILFELPFPNPDDERFTRTPNAKKRRTDAEAMKHYKQERRSLLRALLLCIKAKLESIEAGIENIEQAFLAQLVMPDGNTIGNWAVPQLEKMYNDGESPPPLLLIEQ